MLYGVINYFSISQAALPVFIICAASSAAFRFFSNNQSKREESLMLVQHISIYCTALYIMQNLLKKSMATLVLTSFCCAFVSTSKEKPSGLKGFVERARSYGPLFTPLVSILFEDTLTKLLGHWGKYTITVFIEPLSKEFFTQYDKDFSEKGKDVSLRIVTKFASNAAFQATLAFSKTYINFYMKEFFSSVLNQFCVTTLGESVTLMVASAVGLSVTAISDYTFSKKSESATSKVSSNPLQQAALCAIPRSVVVSVRKSYAPYVESFLEQIIPSDWGFTKEATVQVTKWAQTFVTDTISNCIDDLTRKSKTVKERTI
jgi:hypothetical protein